MSRYEINPFNFKVLFLQENTNSDTQIEPSKTFRKEDDVSLQKALYDFGSVSASDNAAIEIDFGVEISQNLWIIPFNVDWQNEALKVEVCPV